MKKITLLILSFLSFNVFAQEIREYEHKTKVQEYKGIEYTLHSEITRTDPTKGKTEYQFTFRWQNTTDKDIYYLGDKFAKAHVANLKSYFWDLKGEDTGLKIGKRKVFVLKADKTYEHHYFTKWFKEQEGALDLIININYNPTRFANSIEELK